MIGFPASFVHAEINNSRVVMTLQLCLKNNIPNDTFDYQIYQQLHATAAFVLEPVPIPCTGSTDSFFHMARYQAWKQPPELCGTYGPRHSVRPHSVWNSEGYRLPVRVFNGVLIELYPANGSVQAMFQEA